MYLQKRHSEGWKFVKVTGLGMYHFIKCKPENVVYQLDYNQERLNNMYEYINMFKDCGWEYMQDFFGYSYFRKPVDKMTNGKDEEIFCDDESRLLMMQRVFKGRMIPLLIIFFLIIIPQIIMQISLGEVAGYFVASVYIAMFVLYMSVFIQFAVRYVQYRRR